MGERRALPVLVFFVVLLVPLGMQNVFAITEDAKIISADIAHTDRFGFSVSISGNTVIVGTPGDDDAGSTSGSAYVFTENGSSWTQQAKLTASDAAAGDLFGGSVSISGDTAIVGADENDDTGSNSGSAYVFTRSGSTWTQQAKLTASDAAEADFFGNSVSISGNTVIVGARNGGDAEPHSGSAYVFTRSGSTWTQQDKLTASDATPGDLFGFSVSISDDTAIVGSAFKDDPETDIGSAYVFTRSGSTWTQQDKLTASDAAGGDRFGTSVSISDDTAIVGSAFKDDPEIDSGSAYVFTRSESTWTQQDKLTASDAAAFYDFGFSVSISDDTAIVGSHENYGFASEAGSAYIFELEPNVGADLSVIKTVQPDFISSGDPILYTIIVKNNGPDTAENVVVVDELPSQAPLDIIFVDSTPSPPVCTFSSGKVTCNLGNMVIDEEKIIGINGKTNDLALRGGFILNAATVTSDTEDPDPLNNRGTALIEIEIEGDLKLFAPDGSEILETQEEFPGGMVVVNDDNDNMDGSFDLNDFGSTNNEDELVKLEIAKLTAPKGELYLNGDLGTDKVFVYKNSDRTNKITSFPVEVSESDVFFVEGLKSSLISEVNFELTPKNQPLESLDLVRLTVIKIESVTFSGNGNSFSKDNVLDDNINPATGNSLGKRVFPGARIEGTPEMIGPFGSNDKVSVNVELSSVVPFDTVIFLKSFDVDDPRANNASIDPNDNPFGGTNGDYRRADGFAQYKNSVFMNRVISITPVLYQTDEDNRGATNGKKSGELLEHFDDTNRDGTFDLGENLNDVNGNGILDKEDLDGIIKMVIKAGEKSNFVDLQVTRQPGDNFKVVTSFDKDFLKQLRNTDGIDGLNIFEKFVNARLTNTLSSDVLTVWRILHLEVDHMGAPSRFVTFDGAGVGNDDVGPIQDIGNFDIFENLGPGVFDLSDRVIRKPDTSLLNPSLNTHYIFVNTIPEVSGLDETDSLLFTKNLSDNIMVRAGVVVRDVPSTSTFWVVQIIGVYEGPTNRDDDGPVKEQPLLGRAEDSSVEGQNHVFIFLETIRDHTLSTNPTMATRNQVEQRAVVHEVGHSLSETHSGGIMSGNFGKNNPFFPLSSLSFTNSQQSAQRSLGHP